MVSEFRMGREAAREVTDAMRTFYFGQDDSALNPYLVNQKNLPALPQRVPRPGFWALWANPRWLASSNSMDG
jgi:hypothetical protein